MASNYENIIKYLVKGEFQIKNEITHLPIGLL